MSSLNYFLLVSCPSSHQILATPLSLCLVPITGRPKVCLWKFSRNVKAYRKDRSSLHQLVCSHTASLIQNLRGRSGGLVLFGRQPISHQASSSHVRTISVATPPHIAIFLSLPTLNSDIRSTPFVSERNSSDQTEKLQWYESDFVLLELIHYGEFLHDFFMVEFHFNWSETTKSNSKSQSQSVTSYRYRFCCPLAESSCCAAWCTAASVTLHSTVHGSCTNCYSSAR